MISTCKEQTFFSRVGAPEFLGGLPETTDDCHDAMRHGTLDVNDGMDMAGHETELQNTDLGIVLVPMNDTLNEVFAKLILARKKCKLQEERGRKCLLDGRKTKNGRIKATEWDDRITSGTMDDVTRLAIGEMGRNYLDNSMRR